MHTPLSNLGFAFTSDFHVFRMYILVCYTQDSAWIGTILLPLLLLKSRMYCCPAVVFHSLVHYPIIILQSHCRVIWRHCSWKGFRLLTMEPVPALFWRANARPIRCPFNTLRPRQDGRYFPDDIFECISLRENIWIPIVISLKFVPKMSN